MCGIFGGYRADPELNNIKKACGSIRHRGPDGESYHQEKGRFLGCVRLAIVGGTDINQPFVSNDRGVRVVANGEIYNWRELQEELLTKGYQFHTDCDLEILPNAWQEWGVGMFPKLNGMFSIAILDGDELILARDSCGQKPLYLAEQDDSLYFSSEIRVFRELGLPLKINKQFVRQYLGLRYVPEPNTLLQGVSILPAGHYLKLGATGQKRIVRWWHPPQVSNEDTTTSYESSIDQLGKHLDKAVQLACPSDQPATLYLSSGIDSALLLDSAMKTGVGLNSVTASFGADSDEGKAAEALAKSYGIDHHHVKINSSIFANLERVVGQMEVPVGDSIILAFDALASATSELGSRVALGGEGPDELFQGYSFQKLLYYAEKTHPALRSAAGLGVKYAPSALLDKISNFPAALGKQGRAKISQWLLDYTQLSDWEKGAGLKMLFSPLEIKSLLDEGDWQEPAMLYQEGVIESHHKQQFNEWLPDWSIIRQDRNTMAHSLEYRMPFLDSHLMDYSGSLPMDYKIRSGQTKWIWRELAKERLGSRVGNISKKPFYMPVEQFIRDSEFKTLVGDLLSYDRIKRRGIFCPHAVQNIVHQLDTNEFLSVKKVMALIIFELWCEQIEF